MESPNQFKHPSLEEYVSRGKEWYDAWVKVNGAQSMQPWPELEKELRQEHKLVSSMDATKQRVYWFEKSKKAHLVLSAVQLRLDKAIVAHKSRQLVGDSLRDAKEQEAHARRTKSR